MGSLNLSLASAVNGGPPVGAEGLLRAACDELERRLRSGEAARAEELIVRYPELGHDPEQALDLIYVEFATRRELGESPPHEEFFARFPQWQALLQRQFHLDEFLDDPPALSEKNGDGSAPYLPASGRFRVLRLFARGGIGQVMRAMDLELNREVAVKEIQPALAGNHEVRERFLREAEITARLEHPGIVPVYGLGRDAAGRPFYAMRLVRGQTLQAAVEELHRRALPPVQFRGVEFQKLLRRFLHVCETVAYAHSRGVIHRDLKPANILLGPYGETLVVDWGLARALGEAGPLAAEDETAPLPTVESLPSQPADSQNAVSAAPAIKSKLPTVRLLPADAPTPPQADWTDALTRTAGEVVGTPAFMSPEQARGEAHGVGPTSDVYNLGATLYMLLTGRPPFAGSGLEETLRGVIAGSFARPRKLSRTIPPPLEAVCLKAMARQPADRYASPQELAHDLEHWLADEPVSAAREPLPAQLARWGRRNRTHVVAGMIALLLITVVSVVAAIRINGERLRADAERREADRQRVEADRERIEANRRTARLAFDRGFALVKSQESGVGMLWFARALRHAPADDAALRRVILTNLDAARQHLVRRGVAFNHPANISALAFSPDGTTILTTDRDETARIWAVDGGELKATHELGSPRVFATMIRADGTPLVAVAAGRTLKLKLLPAGVGGETAADVALVHPDVLLCAAFSPEGSQVCTVTGQSTGPQPASIRIWQTAGGKQLAEFAGPAGVLSVTFQPRGPAVATLSRNGRVRLWNATGGGMIGEPFPADGTRATQIAFMPDGNRILLGDQGGSLSCWNARTGKRMFLLPNSLRGSIVGLACAADGQAVVATSNDGTARVWDLQDRRALGELIRLDRHAGNLAFRPGTRQILLAAKPRSAVLWDIPATTRWGTLLDPNIQAVAFSPDGLTAVTGSRSGTARLYNVATGRTFGKVMNHAKLVKRVALRPDGEVVLTASLDGTAQLWNAADGEPRCEPMSHRFPTGAGVQVETAVFSPDGRVVLTGDSNGLVRIWNGDTGELIHVFEKINGPTDSVCFSPDGTRIVASFASPSNAVRVWDSASREVLWEAEHGDRVRTVTVSPDGRVVMSASNDETARFWDARDGHQLGPELRHGGEVFVAAFRPDSRLAVSGGYDATVRLWDVPTGRPVGEPMRHEDVVRAAVFSSDGQTLLTGSADRSARLWDVATCLPLGPPMLHDSDVVSVAFDRAGRTALTGRLWRLPAPLPDDPALVDLWVQLATQRTFTAGDSIEWLDPAVLTSLTKEFHARTGKSWSEWADATP